MEVEISSGGRAPPPHRLHRASTLSSSSSLSSVTDNLVDTHSRRQSLHASSAHAAEISVCVSSLSSPSLSSSSSSSSASSAAVGVCAPPTSPHRPLSRRCGGLRVAALALMFGLGVLVVTIMSFGAAPLHDREVCRSDDFLYFFCESLRVRERYGNTLLEP